MVGRCVRLLAGALAVLFVTQAPVGAQTTTPLPLLPNEVIVPMQNCAMVFPGAAVTPEVRATYAKMLWTGACRYGLIDGWGVMGEQSTLDSIREQHLNLDSQAFYGRLTGLSRSNAFGGNSVTWTAGGKLVSYDGLDDAMTPRWGAFMTAGDPAPTSLMIMYGGGAYRRVATSKADCTYFDRDKWDAEAKRANKGCGQGAQFPIYGVTVSTNTDTTGVTTYCPDPRTYVGCEGLWRQQLGTMVADAATIKAEIVAKMELDHAAIAATVQAYETQLAAADAAAKHAAAERAAAAQAAQDQAMADFRASLAAKNAGQLFALADELRTKGDDDRAREVLRTLVSRFPDHPLSVTAAQQLSAMSSAPGGASMASASRPAASAPAVTSTSAASRSSSSAAGAASGMCAGAAAEEERLGQLAYQSGQNHPGEARTAMESLLWAVQEIENLYRSCPGNPESAGKLQVYGDLYTSTMTTCSAISSTGTCQAVLH